MSTAFFLPDPHHPGRYNPTGCTVGPWSPQHQHGGPPIALLAQALCRQPSAAPMDLARLTVEFLGPVPLDECEVSVRVLRPGKRVELLQGEYRVGGRPILTAQAWRMQREPGICPPIPEPWSPPPLPAAETRRFFLGGEGFPYGRSLEWRFAEGGFDRLGPATVWARSRIPLVEGEETLGAAGLLTLLDSANGVSCELDISRWTFVPVDLTLNLHRQPVGPWFGMAANTVIDDGGIGTVNTIVFDPSGPVGRSLHTLFVRPKSG
ncbi:MAG: thioesterase family protein [Burkholderiaceae bacterium]|jgi:Thioesterase-like superfamily